MYDRNTITDNRLLLMILASLYVFYYVLPSSIAIGLNFILFIIYFKKKFVRLPIKWYGIFLLLITFYSLIRDHEFVYLSSCTNVFIVILTLCMALNEKIKISLFIKYSSIAGGLFCAYMYIRYNSFLGAGRFGMELPGTRIESAITLGYIFLYISCMQIYSLFETDKLWKNIGYVLAIMFTLYLTFYTGTRKAMILPIVSIIMILLLKYFKRPGKLIWLLSLVMVIGVFLVSQLIEVMPQAQVDRLYGLVGLVDGNVDVDDSTLERIILAQQAINLFLENPIFGYGIDNTLNVLQKHAHNNFLSLLSFGGLLLFCCYYWIYGHIIRKIRHYYTASSILTFIVLIALPLSDLGTTSFNILYFNILITILLIYGGLHQSEIKKPILQA